MVFVVKHTKIDVLIMNSEYMTTFEAFSDVVKINMPGIMVHRGTNVDIVSLVIHCNVLDRNKTIFGSLVLFCNF